MAIFDSPEETLKTLQDAGYFTDLQTATTVYVEANLKQAILLEGPAGAGKTELANALARSTGMRLVRLQCVEGIKPADAIGHYDESLRRLYAESPASGGDWNKTKQQILSRDFFMPGPLLESIESEERCVLLIDEVDKVDHKFEAQLLEILSEWEISVPHLGTIKARTIPFVIVTSNAERELGLPLRRRCAYLVVDHPTPEREAAIVARRTPNCSIRTHEFIAGLAQALRGYNLKKPPSISEMIVIALAMQLLGFDRLTGAHKEVMLPFIAKLQDDRLRLLMKESFEAIVNVANLYVERKALLESGVLNPFEPFLTKKISTLSQLADRLLGKCWEAVPKLTDVFTSFIILAVRRLGPKIIQNDSIDTPALDILVKTIPGVVLGMENHRLELCAAKQNSPDVLATADSTMLPPPDTTVSAAMAEGAGA